MSCKCCTRNKRLCCLFSCGAISFILTIFFSLAVGFHLTDELFFLIIKKGLQLVPHNSVVDDWAESDVPSYKMIYIFDTQNPDQFSEGAIPVVREVGPFTYREYDKKVKLKWNSDESLVTYNRVQYHTFVPEKSIGDPRNYNITVLNIPLLIILNQQREIENLLFRILGTALAQFYVALIRDQTLFVKKTAQEIIWGYSDPILSILRLLGLRDPLMSAQLNVTDPTLLYTVHTGKKDMNSVDSLVQWMNMTKIDQWGSEYASHIVGSLSGHFKPKIEKHDVPILFIEPLFRHVEVVYTGQASLYGINLYRYEAAHHVFSNSSEYPPNAGYYAYGNKYGVINLTAVSFKNVPMYFSKPHCLGCDPEYFRNVSGYHPDKSKHETYARIEPFTGLTMEIAQRGQNNIRIEQNLLSRQLSNIPDVTIYPWFYASREVTITKDKADDFKLSIQLPLTILKISVIVFLCISGVTLLCMMGVLLRSCRNNRWLWNNTTICKSPPKKKSDSPVRINHSDDSTSPLLDNNKSTYYQTVNATYSTITLNT